MSVTKKAKTSAKSFITDPEKLKSMVLNTMGKVSSIVSSTLGPGGKNVLIEAEQPGLPHTITKDGVSVFKSLGSKDPYEHLIIETARDAATKTVDAAGDGTTTATILSYSIIKNMFEFCEKNKKYSPQKAARRITQVTKDILLPYIASRSTLVTEDNQHLLKMVAKISANGDEELADAVIKAFEVIGYGDSSHVTIKQLSGPQGFKVERIDGFPIPMGYENSIGRLHTSFLNDHAAQRIFLETPKFLLFDGSVNDLSMFLPIINGLNDKCMELQSADYKGNEKVSDYRNIVLVAHSFSQEVLTTLALTFAHPNSMRIVPLITPMEAFHNSQLHFLNDLSAFTGAKVFGLKNQANTCEYKDLGQGMEAFEGYRFRSTIVGQPKAVNVEVRADELRIMMEDAESMMDKVWLQERLGKITNGIAKLTVYGGSGGQLREIADRTEDAVMAVKSSITHGVLPGGCRIALDMAQKLLNDLPPGDPAREVLVPSLMSLPHKLLDNAGYNAEEIGSVLQNLYSSPDQVYDVENQVFGSAEELGLFDAAEAVKQALTNSVSIASVLGVCGGIVCFPRDDAFELSEAKQDAHYNRAVESPESFTNEANERG